MFVHYEQGFQRPSHIAIAGGDGIFDSNLIQVCLW
jgi:hypothetical protein